ncbi:MAG: SMP-30/gluconolactonase/LRE family protein [Saprospiraceae bacterium]
MKKEVRAIFDIQAEHGEGPVWDEKNQQLYWVDIGQGKFYTGDLASGRTAAYSIGQALGVLGLREMGGIVMAVRDGFGFFDEKTGLFQLIEPSPEQHNALVRFNDGAVDPAGRFFAGTMAWDEEQCLGKLFRLDPDLSWEAVEDHLHIPNGMGWSKDLSTYFMIDTMQQAVFAYDYDVSTGAIANRRKFIEFPKGEFPDGMCMDSEDGFWIALWGLKKVVHFDHSGKRVAEIIVPALHPTSCCFGGEQMQTLFITSSQRDLTPAQKIAYPLAGRTFVIETDVVGKVEPRFRG